MNNLLDALNAYSKEMKAAEVNKPATLRRMEVNDVLVNDKLVIDASYTDVNKQIEAGGFESRNDFAITAKGDIVYTSAYIVKRYFKIDFLVDKKILMRLMDKQSEYITNV